jgi:hypothetical protein
MAVFWVVAQTTRRYNPEDSYLHILIILQRLSDAIPMESKCSIPRGKSAGVCSWLLTFI